MAKVPVGYVPPEVTLGSDGRQVLGVIDSEDRERAGQPFERYVECESGCGYLIGCGQAIDTISHLSCSAIVNGAEQ